MHVPTTTHPTDQTLNDYGLGKLDDSSSSAIESHLESCSDCRGRLSGPSSDTFLARLRDAQKSAGESAPGATTPLDGTISMIQARPTTGSPPPAESLPTGLADHADYEIRRELGRGGMGVVYLAHNTMMGRDEVLKVMGRHVIERPGVLERFQREIRAVAQLRHPNIVAAYTAFRIEGGLVFAMEYVEGLDLARLVKAKGPLPVAHAAYFIHQAALGLQHAHERGMVHRDIKPHNLMLTHDGTARVVKVLDFGLAKANREQKVDAWLTSEGQALGTPDYIAPEQILNAAGADIRADLYSLGGTLFYLLTGRPPFQATSLYDMYQAHISREAEALNLVRPEVPAELAALVSKMMAKDPQRRFQTPGEVAQALRPFFRLQMASAVAEISKVGPAKPGRARIVETPTPTGHATSTSAPTPQQKRMDETNESAWDTLIDTKKQESLKQSKPAIAGSIGRIQGRYLGAMAATAILGLVITLGVVIRKKNG